MAAPKLLSSGQMALIKAQVRLRHAALTVELLGDGAVAPKVLREIRKAGLYRPAKRDMIKSAYSFGRFALRDPNIENMSAADFEAYLRAHHLTIDARAQKALAKQREALEAHIKSLGDALIQKIDKAVADAEKGLSEATAGRRLSLAEATDAREKAAQALVRAMHGVTQQQLGAAQRVAETQANNVYQLGRAHEVLSKSGESDPWVFKRPRGDCCQECRDAYLMPDGHTPKLFRLSALQANGSNVGKSRAERLPVVDSLHPHCCCELGYLPPGFAFGPKGAMVYVGRQKAAHG